MFVVILKDVMIFNDKFVILEGIFGFVYVLDFFVMYFVVWSMGLWYVLESGRWERLFLLWKYISEFCKRCLLIYIWWGWFIFGIFVVGWSICEDGVDYVCGREE